MKRRTFLGLLGLAITAPVAVVHALRVQKPSEWLAGASEAEKARFKQEMESLYRKCCAGSPSDEPEIIIADSGIHWRREMEIDWSLPKYMRNRGGA